MLTRKVSDVRGTSSGNAAKGKWRDAKIIATGTIVLFLLIDVTVGRQLLSMIYGELPKDKFRIQHSIYHHTLLPNYQGIGYWGPGQYHICTNGSGFKDSCDKVGTTQKSFDIAFVGDSFTEGVGLPFEQTFVGMFAMRHPELKIANLGVVGYAPRIYLAKLKDYYDKGYKFNKVIVFIDISDVMDEAITYDLVDGRVINKQDVLPVNGLARIRRIASRWLPLTGEAWNRGKATTAAVAHLIRPEDFSGKMDSPSSPQFQQIPTNSDPALVSAVSSPLLQPKQPVDGTQPLDRNLSENNSPAADVSLGALKTQQTLKSVIFAQKVEPSIYDRNFGRSEWTYNTKSEAYGSMGVEETLKQMLATMNELYLLVKKNGGQLSVGIYPWPGQLKYDVEDSLQARIWGEFCATRCEHFFNAFPAFFKLKSQLGENGVIYKHYMLGDMHFNEAGNAVVAQTLFESELQ